MSKIADSKHSRPSVMLHQLEQNPQKQTHTWRKCNPVNK